MRRLRSRVLPVLCVGGLIGAAWACGGTNNSGDGDASADGPTTDAPLSESATEGSVEDGPHDAARDAHHHDAATDGGPDGSSDVVPSDVGSDVHDGSKPEVGPDVHDSGPPDVHDSSIDVADSPPDTPPDVPPPDAPPFDAGVPVTIATGEAPITLAADDTYVYWENSGDAVLDCPVAGCPSNVPTILAFDGSGFGLESLAVGSTTAFFLDSSYNIDSCAGGGCGLAPSIYDGVADGGFTEFEAVVTDSANAYFTDGTSIYSCPLASTCASPTTLYTSLTSFVSTLAVSSTNLFFVLEGSLTTLRSIPITGGSDIKICEPSPLNDVVSMVATSEYVYFTSGDSPTRIIQCPAGGGAAEFYTTDTAPYGLATDGTYLYWTNDADPGSIIACGAGGSCTSPFTIASGQDFPTAIALNSTHIFWATATAIYSAAR